MKSEVSFFKDRRIKSGKTLLALYRSIGYSDEQIAEEMRKIKAAREPRIIKQIEPHMTIYLLDNVGYRRGKPLEAMGCEWTPGPDGGAWHITEDVANKFAARGVPIITYQREEN